MRYLNKIIFINSAHVPYAEIKLDGNVHFIGTQGVGKSTLLRSILFFYNVDKSKLGIKTQTGQKGYDEFYLPHQNSYIIYEVCRETGKFFVMTFLSHGRTAFRIVDCAYDKRFFVEEDGSVRYEWGRISEQIGSRVFRSNIIRGYEEFRDIIYGNTQQVAKELRRFSLMESTKYRQVPLTIQNIFLNQSLESRVIKDTIIDSMDFASDDIDLNRYREELKSFRQQYDDIWKWYKVEKNGKVKVKIDAEAVIERYTDYEYVRKLITELCGQLNYALERDTNRLPHLAEQETSCHQELSRQRRLLGEENDKFTKERDGLKGSEAIIDDFLKKLKEKRQHYAEIGIGRIAERIGKEGELKIQKQSLSHQEETLTSKNQSVKSKYDTLIQDVENQLQSYKIQCQQRINELDGQHLQAESRLQTETGEQTEAIRGKYEQKLKENQTQLDEARQTKNDLILQQQRVKQSNPYQEEMDEQERRLKELNDKQLKLCQESSGKQQEIDRILNETAIQRKDLENACEKEVAAIENETKQINAEIEKVTDMLSRQKGSLIEWLGENVNGWEENIGRVLDEDAVLYNTSLNPQFVGSSDGIYGVQIETANIEKTIKTPEELKAQKASMEQKIEELNKKIALRKQQLEADIAELERKPNARLKQLRMEKMNVDAEYNQIPHRIQQQKFEDFKQAVIRFKGNFSVQNTFHFRTEFNTDVDYTEFAAELNEFISNNKIEQYRVRTSRQYATIIKRIAKDVSDLSQHKSDIERTILDINRDFRENNFAGVIKEIELRAVESNDRLMQQLLNIKHFDDEHGYDIGQLNLFTAEDNLNRTNEQAVKLLMTLIEMMDAEQKRDTITLSDTFKVKENDNDTNWVEKLSNVGSDGTDILVKAMVNIMLINVFKRKISRKFGDFKLHCMMDEIGKLHPNNVEGILDFASKRNIFLINSSPTTYNALAYKYTYSLSKDEKSNTIVKTLLTIR